MYYQQLWLIVENKKEKKKEKKSKTPPPPLHTHTHTHEKKKKKKLKCFFFFFFFFFSNTNSKNTNFIVALWLILFGYIVLSDQPVWLCTYFEYQLFANGNCCKFISHLTSLMSLKPVGCWGHYENTPIQIYRKFYLQKLKIFRSPKFRYFFHISAQNIDCGYSLEPPRRGGSNEYPQSMFLSRNKTNNVHPCKPQFYYIKNGVSGGQNYIGMFS